MHEHIRTVVGRYKGRIAGWDVVNEGLNEDGTLHESPWKRIIGEEYIAKAFQFAHQADLQRNFITTTMIWKFLQSDGARWR
jgi:endo-1,4-beta-xylanase